MVRRLTAPRTSAGRMALSPQVGHYAPLSALRGMVTFVLLSAFAYGVLRSVGEAVK